MQRIIYNIRCKGGFYMSKNYMQEIKSRILASEDGSVFSTSDFADIADTNTVRSALYRLVKDNILRRIINGIYEKPKYQLTKSVLIRSFLNFLIKKRA